MLARFIHKALDLFYPAFRSTIPFKVFAYLAVGGLNTALNILLFSVLYQFVFVAQRVDVLGFTIMSYTMCLLIAFFSTLPTGFWLSRHITFRNEVHGDASSVRQMLKYILIVSSGLIADYLILRGFVLAGTYPPLAKLMSTIIVLTLSFLLQKNFTFREPRNVKDTVQIYEKG